MTKITKVIITRSVVKNQQPQPIVFTINNIDPSISEGIIVIRDARK
jgi:hypothetical protein